MASAALFGDQAAHPLQVLGRVDAGAGRGVPAQHRDALAVPQDAQLLERFLHLERAAPQVGESVKEGRAVGVDADVPQRRRPIRGEMQANARQGDRNRSCRSR